MHFFGLSGDPLQLTFPCRGWRFGQHTGVWLHTTIYARDHHIYDAIKMSPSTFGADLQYRVTLSFWQTSRWLQYKSSARPGQAKTELMFSSQQEIRHKLNDGHPVHNSYNLPFFIFFLATPPPPTADVTYGWSLDIFTDTLSDTDATTPNTALSRGACLEWTQLPC